MAIQIYIWYSVALKLYYKCLCQQEFYISLLIEDEGGGGYAKIFQLSYFKLNLELH